MDLTKLMEKYLAQVEKPLGSSPILGLGILGEFTYAGGPLSLMDRVISIIIGIMTIVAFIYFLFILFSGAIAVMSAGGDKARVAEARGRITSGLIGLVVVVAAMFIVDLIANLIGINILNPGEVILGFVI